MMIRFNSEEEYRAYKILQAIKETREMLTKAEKRYNDTIEWLKMEIKENEELGNTKSANQPWVEYALKNKNEVKRLKLHLEKLMNLA